MFQYNVLITVWPEATIGCCSNLGKIYVDSIKNFYMDIYLFVRRSDIFKGTMVWKNTKKKKNQKQQQTQAIFQ